MRPLFVLTALAAALPAAVYDVGPRKPYSAIGKVPWDDLQPGDTVRIHWRQEPYKEKWFIHVRGAQGAPITVRGIPGPGGQLPLIDGEDAVTPRSGQTIRAEERGVLQIRPPEFLAGTPPAWIVVEDLDIRGGRTPYGFTGADGRARKYARNACAVYIRGEHITIRHCIIRDSSNGLFAGTPDRDPTRDIVVEANYIHDNGEIGSIYEHNSYTAALGIVFQYNHFGPLRPGCRGNNLKDRSAGLIVRYNWIEGGNRELDLVDAEDSSALRAEPSYRETRVYGNILVEPPNDGNYQIVHYGGDSRHIDWYRKGLLLFFANTVVSRRTDRTTLFRLSTDDERCQAFNNVFYSAVPGAALSILNAAGQISLSHNWIQPGWRPAFEPLTGHIADDGTNIEGAAPGFHDEVAQDYRPAANSSLLRPAVAMPVALDRQYRKHQRWQPRKPVPTIGALGR